VPRWSWDGRFADQDLERLIEEVDDLGGALKRSVRGRIRTIIEHLLKLEHAPAPHPRGGWYDTIIWQRSDSRSGSGAISSTSSRRASAARSSPRARAGRRVTGVERIMRSWVRGLGARLRIAAGQQAS
jgi:Domain of unknown function DUF29